MRTAVQTCIASCELGVAGVKTHQPAKDGYLQSPALYEVSAFQNLAVKYEEHFRIFQDSSREHGVLTYQTWKKEYETLASELSLKETGAC